MILLYYLKVAMVKFYKNTKIIEIKQGPYIEGKDKKILKIK